jgi:hypothetical protein
VLETAHEGVRDANAHEQYAEKSNEGAKESVDKLLLRFLVSSLVNQGGEVFITLNE